MLVNTENVKKPIFILSNQEEAPRQNNKNHSFFHKYEIVIWLQKRIANP